MNASVVSVEGFLLWAEERSKLNTAFALLFEQIFTYYFATHLYHSGVRDNKTDWINAADSAFAPLWFAAKKPNYAKLQILAQCDYSLMKDDVKNLVNEYSVFSRTDTKGKYQGLDAYLEEIHKEATKFLPHNPTDEDWKRAFINLQYYRDLDKSFKRSSVTQSHYSIRRRKYPVRNILYHRLMSYFATDDEGNLTETIGTLQANSINPIAVQFTEKAATFRRSYIQSMLKQNNRTLPIRFELMYLSTKEYQEEVSRKENTVSSLTSQITGLFHEYEETMRRHKSVQPSKVKWKLYQSYQEKMKTFTKGTKELKIAYLKNIAIEIRSSLAKLKEPIKITLRVKRV
jgi:hypothetical protein